MHIPEESRPPGRKLLARSIEGRFCEYTESTKIYGTRIPSKPNQVYEPRDATSLQPNRISLRSKWTFVNDWKAPLSNPLSTHHRTPRSQTPAPKLSHPLKTSRIAYYNNPSQTNPSPTTSSKHHRARAPHHYTCQEALPTVYPRLLAG